MRVSDEVASRLRVLVPNQNGGKKPSEGKHHQHDGYREGNCKEQGGETL